MIMITIMILMMIMIMTMIMTFASVATTFLVGLSSDLDFFSWFFFSKETALVKDFLKENCFIFLFSQELILLFNF